MSKGLVNQYLRSPLEESSPYLSVHRVSVLRPIIQMGDMIILYIEDVRQTLVPLEIIFRFGVPQGSSLMKRIDMLPISSWFGEKQILEFV